MKLSYFKILNSLIIILIFIALYSHGTAFAQSKTINITVPYIDEKTNVLYVNQGGWISGDRPDDINFALKWSSSDPSILKIYSGPKGSMDCAFVAKKAGVVTVTATDSSGYKEKIKITVVEKAPDGITLGKQTIPSNGETAVLYYKIFTINNNQKACAGLLVDASGNNCVSMGGRLQKSVTDTHVFYRHKEFQNLTGSWYIKFYTKGFSLVHPSGITNSYNTVYSANGYYDAKKNPILVDSRYHGAYYINNKKYGIDQSYTIENGWKYTKYKYYNNLQLMVRYAYYELIKIAGSSSDTIAQIDNYTLNYFRSMFFKEEFEEFYLAQVYKPNKNADAKYGEDTLKSPLVIEEGTKLAQALEKFCGVSTVEELPAILPIDQEYFNWPDLSVGTFDNYYVITSGDKAGSIVYVDNDGNGVKDPYGVFWFGVNISN